MKVRRICAACIMHRGIKEIELATSDPDTSMRAIRKLFRFLSEDFCEDAVSATLGTMRDRIVREETGCTDPYKQKKALSNDYALKSLPKLRSAIEAEHDGYRRFRRACLAAIAANAIEFDMLEHDQKLENFQSLLSEAERYLEIDDIPKIFSKVRDSTKILYLADNAGEIVIDYLFIKEIRKLCSSVIVAVKEGPILNDATMEDAKLAKIPEVADEVITTGLDAAGLILSEASPKLRNHLAKTDLIVSKGMGNYETISEETIAGKCIAYLLRAKCSAVAEDLGVKNGANVAKLHCWK